MNRIGHSIAVIDLGEGSKWGLTDLYPECERNLRATLSKTDDFHVTWDSKKELLSADIVKIDGRLHVTASAWMDDLWDQTDLIYDALYEVTGKEEELDDETIDEIRDMAYEVGCDDTATAHWEGDCSKYDELMKIISNLENRAMEENSRQYKMLCEIVKEVIA